MTALAKLFWKLLTWIDFILFTLVMYVLTYLPRKAFGPIFEKLFQAWSRSFAQALGVTQRVHQHYKGKLPEHYIVIANHPGAFEDIGMPALFKAYSVAKIDVASWFIVGRISTASGTVYLKRDNKDSRSAAADSIKQALLDGANIAIYPEGGCYGRRINRFLYGIFTISLETGVPIIPVFIHYEAQEDFEWDGQTLPQKIGEMMKAQNRTAHYHIFDPFDPKDFPDRETYTEHVHACYLKWQDKYLL